MEKIAKENNLIEQLNLITAARIKQRAEFDHKIFYTATALLGFSVALAGIFEQPIELSLLIWTWVLDGLALVSHLILYIFIDRDLKFKQNILFDKYEERLAYLLDDKRTNASWIMKFLTIASLLLLSSAIVCLLIFSFENISQPVLKF
jgi:hypothetical protein